MSKPSSWCDIQTTKGTFTLKYFGRGKPTTDHLLPSTVADTGKVIVVIYDRSLGTCKRNIPRPGQDIVAGKDGCMVMRDDVLVQQVGGQWMAFLAATMAVRFGLPVDEAGVLNAMLPNEIAWLRAGQNNGLGRTVELSLMWREPGFSNRQGSTFIGKVAPAPKATIAPPVPPEKEEENTDWTTGLAQTPSKVKEQYHVFLRAIAGLEEKLSLQTTRNTIDKERKFLGKDFQPPPHIDRSPPRNDSRDKLLCAC